MFCAEKTKTRKKPFWRNSGLSIIVAKSVCNRDKRHLTSLTGFPNQLTIIYCNIIAASLYILLYIYNLYMRAHSKPQPELIFASFIQYTLNVILSIRKIIFGHLSHQIASSDTSITMLRWAIFGLSCIYIVYFLVLLFFQHKISEYQEAWFV